MRMLAEQQLDNSISTAMRSHQMLIDTAMDVARAIAAGRSEDGTPLARTLGETFIR